MNGLIRLGRAPRWAVQRTLWGYVFVLPAFVYFLLIHVVAMLVSFSYSFQKYMTLSTERSWVGLANYQRVLAYPKFMQALGNTLEFAAVRVPAVLVISLAVALLLRRIRRAKGLFRALYFIPFVTSGVAIAWVWKFIYLPNFGVFTPLFDLLGMQRVYILGNPRTALLGIIAVRVWGSIGYYALIFLAGLEDIPQVFYEAAEVDGASKWQAFIRITIPLLNPVIVLVSVLLLVSSLKTFTIVKMMGDSMGGPLGSTLTLPLMIYLEGFRSMQMGRASAIAVVFFILVLLASLAQRRLVTREFQY